MKRMLAIGAIITLCGCTGIDNRKPAPVVEMPNSAGVVVNRVGVIDGCDLYEIHSFHVQSFVLRCPCGVAAK